MWLLQLAPLKLLFEGFSATMAGMPLDQWLASLPATEREALTRWSRKVADHVPGLIDGAIESDELPMLVESTDEDRQA